MIKKILLIAMVILYTGAGVNHFIHPLSYISIIPPYFPFPAFINYSSGILEILLGILLLFTATRKIAAIGIIILLFLFIPVHVFMIQKGGCVSSTVCWPNWFAWIRLFPLQIVLILWAWWVRK